MKNPEQTQAIHNTLNDYATALNAADIDSIPAFYSSDGIFMPAGYPTITKPAHLTTAAEGYLVKTAFNIEYYIEDIVIDNQFAFVTAHAKTLQKDNITGAVIGKTSRDFFILKEFEDRWKIYRYIFNNVTVIELSN